jgi:trans-aconitate 2-methyltransferase
MTNHQAILDWMGSTGMRPYLDALSDSRDQQQFLDEVLKRVQADYPIQPDGTVVFPFQRLFVVAYRC